MRDTFEDQLATRLGALGETVPDEMPPPIDLEYQVLRRRRRTRTTRRWTGLSVAAAVVVVAVSGVAALRTTPGHGSIQVESSSTTAAGPAPVLDSLQPGTLMLSSFGRWVVSLNAAGRQTATMVTVDLGSRVIYARATDDHRQIWYLSLKKGKTECGDVVRADIDRGNSSTIVTHAVAFDVSPDGSRLALYGAGDLEHGRCAPVRPGVLGRIVVLDLASGAAAATPVGHLASMRWSADGSYLAHISCESNRCADLGIVNVPRALDGPLVDQPAAVSADPSHTVHAASLAIGPDGVYTLASTTPSDGASTGPGASTRVDRVVPWAVQHAPTAVFDGGGRWKVSQVVPTTAGIYVVAAATTTRAKVRGVGPTGLYLVAGGRLAYVRGLESPGILTPVTPLAAG